MFLYFKSKSWINLEHLDEWYLDNVECLKSYGENCQYQCSQHCINQTCDRFNGKCLSWCRDGFFGEKCDQG